MSKKTTDMVKVEVWVLCLTDSDSGEPKFYYNPKKDILEREKHMEQTYCSENACLAKEKELNIDGLTTLKGTIDVPKDILINAIVDTFTEQGLIKPEHQV